MLRIASVGVSALMLLAPMFADAAAPETAMAVAKSSSLTSSSNSSVFTYWVALLPMNLGLKTKKSAFRPRRLAYFVPLNFKGPLMEMETHVDPRVFGQFEATDGSDFKIFVF